MIRLEMNKKQEAILAAIIIIAALGAFVLYTGIGRPAAEPEQGEDSVPSLAATVAQAAEQQNSVFERLHEEMESGKYRFESPLVVVDPYGVSPLTAFVIFQTEEVVRISVKVTGKDDSVSITRTFAGFETSHMIPVYGLYPDMVNLVEITAEPADVSGSEVRSKLLLIETGEMPEEFSGNLILRYRDDGDDSDDSDDGNLFVEAVPPIYIFPETGDSEDYLIRLDDIEKAHTYITEHNLEITGIETAGEPPFYFTYVPLCAFDKNGDYRWYYNGFDTKGTTAYLDNGNMLIYIDPETGELPLLLEINMFGRIIFFAPYIETNYGAEYFDANHVFRRDLYNN